MQVALGTGPASVTWIFVRRTVPALAAGTVLGIAASFGVGNLVKATLAGTAASMRGRTVWTITVI